MCKCLQRVLCECPAKLGDIARIAEVGCVSSVRYVRFWVAIAV